MFWVSKSCFWLGLAFFLRAGLAGTAREKRKRATYIAEQIFFVVAATIWGKFGFIVLSDSNQESDCLAYFLLNIVDSPVLSLTRDVVYIDALESEAAVAGKKLEQPLPKKPKHWFSRFTMIGRVMVLLSGILAVVGFTKLPEPGDAQSPSKESSQYRLAAALILFLVVLLNVSP